MANLLDASGLNKYTQALKNGTIKVGRSQDASYSNDASTAFFASHSAASGIQGTISIDNLPQGILERLVKVENSIYNIDSSIVRIDSSVVYLDDKLDASVTNLNVYVDGRLSEVDSSISDLTLVDIELGNAIETFVEERDIKYEELSNRIDALVQNATIATLEITPKSIYVGKSSTLILKGSTLTTSTSLIIKDPSDTQIASDSGKSLVAEITVTPSEEGVLGYTFTALIGTTTYAVVTNVNCVNKIYYGCGNSYTDITTVAPITPIPSGSYTINVDQSGKYIFFIVPASMTISKVSINGLIMPMSMSFITKDGISYKSYQSTNGYDAGIFVLDVT